MFKHASYVSPLTARVKPVAEKKIACADQKQIDDERSVPPTIACALPAPSAPVGLKKRKEIKYLPGERLLQKINASRSRSSRKRLVDDIVETLGLD